MDLEIRLTFLEVIPVWHELDFLNAKSGEGDGPTVINTAEPFLWIKRRLLSPECNSEHLINITQICGTDIYNHKKKQGCLNVWGA